VPKIPRRADPAPSAAEEPKEAAAPPPPEPKAERQGLPETGRRRAPSGAAETNSAMHNCRSGNRPPHREPVRAPQGRPPSKNTPRRPRQGNSSGHRAASATTPPETAGETSRAPSSRCPCARWRADLHGCCAKGHPSARGKPPLRPAQSPPRRSRKAPATRIAGVPAPACKPQAPAPQTHP